MTIRSISPLRAFPLIVLTVILSLGGTRALAASAPTVRDDAHLLDPSTVEQVNALVREIHDRCGKDLAIRTFETIPETLQPRFSAEKKEAFYEDWLRREAREANTNGIFVLIVKNPGRLQIGVGNHTRQKAFTNADRDEMRDLMLAQFREKKFDVGVIQGAKFVLERMEKNGAARAGNHSQDDEPSVPVEPQPSPATAPVATPATQPATRPAVEPSATKPANAESDNTKPAAPGSVESNK